MVLFSPRCLAAIVLACAIPGSLSASNWQWMRDSALSSFTQTDLQLMENAINQALEAPSAGRSSNWNNQETGHEGSVELLRIRETESGICRDLLIRNDTGKEAGTTQLAYCLQSDGEWRIDNRVRREQQK